jgi:DNA-binding LacI/PurR family transcriptional regulator
MGRTRVRLVDIANEVGVSRAVVGRVLLGSGANIRVGREKARQIRQIAKRLNYKPNQIARQLGGKGSQLLGVLIGEGKSQGRFHRLLAVEAESRRRGYRILIGQIANSNGEVDEYIDEFDAYNVEALLYLDTRYDICEALANYPGAITSAGQGCGVCGVGPRRRRPHCRGASAVSWPQAHRHSHAAAHFR